MSKTGTNQETPIAEQTIYDVEVRFSGKIHQGEIKIMMALPGEKITPISGEGPMENLSDLLDQLFEQLGDMYEKYKLFKAEEAAKAAARKKKRRKAKNAPLRKKSSRTLDEERAKKKEKESANTAAGTKSVQDPAKPPAQDKQELLPAPAKDTKRSSTLADSSGDVENGILKDEAPETVTADLNANGKSESTNKKEDRQEDFLGDLF